jgi:hypothetical protein
MEISKRNKRIVNPGDTFNHWTIINEIQTGTPIRKVECRCVCGTKKVVILQNLIRNMSTSCGCSRDKSIRKSITKYNENEIIGKKFDNWTITKFLPSKIYTYNNGKTNAIRRVNVVCDCGITKNINLGFLISDKQRPKCKCSKSLKEKKPQSNTKIVKSIPPIEWFVEQLSNHPDFNVKTIIDLLKQIK